MARSAAPARRPPEPPTPRLRPLLLAGGLGLIWFVEFQGSGVTDDAPAWSLGVIAAVRLFVDFVGGWVVVSLARLAFSLGRLWLAQWRTGSRQQGTT